MSGRNVAVDAGWAVLVLVLSLAALATGGFGQAEPDARALDGWGVALTLATAVPLAARRIAALAVYALVGAASVVLTGLNYPLDLPFGALVAVYSLGVAYGGETRLVRRWAALVAAVAFVPAELLALRIGGHPVVEFLPELSSLALLWAGLWVTGDRTRLRREQMAALEERAFRTEREAERERRLAAAEERTRIARELHDSAGHAINVILVQAGAARLLHHRDPAGSQQAIATIEEIARGTISEIDQLVRALREDTDAEPAPTEPGGLEELLEHHRTAGLRLNTHLTGAHRVLPRGIAWAAYRILQEALTNAARHGSGSAEVSVWFGPSAVEITVVNPTDPARGLDGVARRAGHGIVGMRERATLLGGTLVASAANGAFRLHTRLPHQAVSS